MNTVLEILLKCYGCLSDTSEVYSQPFKYLRRSFLKKPLTVFEKNFYLRCLTGSEYVSGLQHILRHSKGVFLVILLLTLTGLHKNVFSDFMRPSEKFSLH